MSVSEFVLLASHFAAGVVIVAVALNKLDRLDVFGVGGSDYRATERFVHVVASLVTPWKWSPDTLTRFADCLAWSACALGGGGAMVAPFTAKPLPSAPEVFAFVGFAIIIFQARCYECRLGTDNAARH